MAGTFVSPPFKLTRTSWIKPSFLWMMCRAGWGKKETNQKRIFAVDIKKQGFDWALQNSWVPELKLREIIKGDRKSAPVTIQWDPERDILCNSLEYRSIQIGLRGEALGHYVTDWITRLTDITHLAHRIHDCLARGEIAKACSLVPVELEYPVSEEMKRKLGMVA